MCKTKIVIMVLAAWLLLPAFAVATADLCRPCNVDAGMRAAQAAEERGEAEGDDQFNPGVIVLAIVLVSILVATVMVLRQSKPSLPPDDEEER